MIKASFFSLSTASLNVTNSYTVAFLHSLGIKRVTLSYELNDAASQVGKAFTTIRTALLVYGKQ